MPLLYSIDIIQELFYFVTSYKMRHSIIEPISVVQLSR